MATFIFDKGPNILEVTLRDGSYLIDFQFTAEDTSKVTAALDATGFRWIEVGHGLGLNASASGKGPAAAATDEEYLAATAQAAKQARWGMFFIPGIGTEEDLRLAARYKMSFVRIGTNVNTAEDGERYIKLAKELGLIVSYNAMKSYAVTPAQFGQSAAKVRSWGADLVCLVDSAGGMYPDDVSAYLKAARDQTDAALGFHGHDNLSLAMANTLRAVECGAELVDSSLQGMGRSAGNAITEVLVATLKQRGFLPEIDLKAVMDVGQALIQPLLGQRGMDPMAVTAGYARFHSSFTSKVQRYAQEHNLDVRDLIVRLCQEDQINAPDALLDRLSRELASERKPRLLTVPAFGTRRPRDVHGLRALELLLKDIRPRAIKAGKYSTLNIVLAAEPVQEMMVSGNIQTTLTHVVGSVVLSSAEHLAGVLKMADGKVDVVLLDVDRKPYGAIPAAEIARQHLKQSLLLTYLDSRVWVDAVEDQVVRLLGEVLDNSAIVIAGDHPKSRFLALRLFERRARATIVSGAHEDEAGWDSDVLRSFTNDPSHVDVACLSATDADATNALSEARLVVLWPKNKAWFGHDEARRIKSGSYVLDAGLGSIQPEIQDVLRDRGALLVRINFWPALAGALAAAHESSKVCSESMGWDTFAEVPVVAGGAMGRRGDVVIDSVREPTRVIGVADGRGGVLFQYNDEDSDRVRRVEEEINRRLLLPRLTGGE